MPWIVGTDEAGYGPRLGPLVISATAWRLPPSSCVTPVENALWALLADVVADSPDDIDASLVVADSKRVYTAGKGLDRLEEGVQAALLAGGQEGSTWSQLWESLAADRGGGRALLPWYTDYDCPLPRHADRQRIQFKGHRLLHRLDALGITLGPIRARAVFPQEFNRLVGELGSKGAVLSSLTLELVQELLLIGSEEPVWVVCDKHGGRNRYAALVQARFSTAWVEVICEGQRESIYRWGRPEARVEMAFRAQSEAALPVALASMVSKYLRELSMEAENHFWRQRVAGLRPTAGYPGDAGRFKHQIARCQQELGIADGLLWRVR
jgi:hypothetical protein